MKRLVVFDLDGTLAESKSRIDPAMATLFSALLRVTKVAVISGGAWPQFEQQLLEALPTHERLGNLTLLPTCGTKLYRFEGAWRCAYSEDFTAEKKAEIIGALDTVLDRLHLRARETWGDVIEDRGSQITLSALGQHAPISAKASWDPDFAKRGEIKTQLERLVPGIAVRIGGMTSVDVTRAGIDKAYGIQKLRELLGIELAEMVFVGDALFPGGNDYPVEQAGVASIRVDGPGETRRVVETILAWLGP